jgi:tetratricopeptide (TPR) repeat protein
MSSLADLPELIGFFSYSREDDDGSHGALSSLRERIQNELRAQLGRSFKSFRLWQDKEAIAPGKLWESEIKTAVEQAVFFIPIITPTVVRSPYCRFELDSFLAREQALGRSDLVFPILYMRVPSLEDSGQQQSDPVLSLIAKRQYVDWREFRHRDLNSTEMKEKVEWFCENVVKALHAPWMTPEERQRLADAEARRGAEKEQQRLDEERRRNAAAEAERQRLESEASAKREADERARQVAVAEAESQRRERDAAAARHVETQRIAEEQRQEQAKAERLAQEEQDRVRAAEPAQLAENETQNEKGASEDGARSKKAAPRRTLIIGALGMIAAIVAIAVWSLAGSSSNKFSSCYQADPNAEVTACTQAIAVNPKDDWAYSNRCSAYSRLGNYRAALADCNQAIAIDVALKYDDNWSVYYNRGFIYEKLGMNAAAIVDYQKVLTMNPSQQQLQYAQDALKRLGASPAAPGGR